jgi:hypothetical protein
MSRWGQLRKIFPASAEPAQPCDDAIFGLSAAAVREAAANSKVAADPGSEVNTADSNPGLAEVEEQDIPLQRTRSWKAPPVLAVNFVTKMQTEVRSQNHVVCCCSETSHGRAWAVSLVTHPWFDNAILLVVLINVILMSMYDPLRDDDSDWNLVVHNADLGFTGIFTVEFVLKLVALDLGG